MLPLVEIQQEVFAALTAALYPVAVHDHVAKNHVYPYVTIGEMSSTPDDPLTRGEGVNTDMTVHTWSREKAMLETELLMLKCKAALHYQRFALPDGQQWVETRWTFSQTLRELDGITRHGVLRFRVSVFRSN